MASFLRDRINLAWLVLVGATLLSFATLSLPGHATVRALGAANVVIAFAKVWLVGHEFMELRRAPAWLRRLFTGWACFAGAALAGLCWL